MDVRIVIHNIWKHAMDAFFPIECAGCAREGDWLCDACIGKIVFNNDFVCPLCGHFSFQGNTCFSCLKHSRLDGAWILGKYNDIMRTCIKCLKYYGIQDISNVLGNLMVKYLDGHSIKNNFDVIIPVPLHKRKELLRGYNQSFLLAKYISEYYAITLDDVSLIRKKYTQSQTKKGREKRLADLKNVFYVKNPSAISGKRILLIDDVLTTGATLSECARALSRANAKSVWGFVLARG